jgi:2-amino-4-hydroxy-6-hydroxymethyldihydropteridine diphosphokinase
LPHIAFIALGSNLQSWAGPPAITLARAVEQLRGLGRVRSLSSLYSTAPVGLSDQPRFVNAVAELESEFEPRLLLGRLLSIEKGFGRNRAGEIPNGPRTLDLDILLVDALEVHEAGLVLPHPRMSDRAFVLVPLDEIAPQLRIPGWNRTVAELLKSLKDRSKDDADAVVRIKSDDWRATARS